MDKIVEIKNLTKMYGTHVVLDKLNLSIRQGEIYGLIGDNGAGKSTIMKVITGLRGYTSGELYLFGKKEKSLIPHERNKIGCLIENPTLYFDMTARQNLEIQRVQRGLVGKKCIDDVLEIVDLQDVGNKKVKSFSLGMKQRLGLAMAMLGKPQFLILDEPMNGLDPRKIRYIREVLQKLNKEDGTTILVSSHILAELHQLANVYGFIKNGKMAQQITNRELDEYCRKHIYIEVDQVEKASCILEQAYSDCVMKVYPENQIRIYQCDVDIMQITKTLVLGDIGVKTICYRGEDLESYYTNLMEGRRGNETTKSRDI